ncbi:hypothetical protein HCN44_004434 [Aphidius gifuensis]|uniref:Survival of motor neuron-related-splicing factor 30 n=1 Tax=Aphidius gifuensis TaxID=684658 RepID=A0A834XZ24_APHGI|nr:tudor domain-containing protein 3 [Aphidius gifuensis]KAF7994962.1 hypothetical protein HCN44_004434 [Aphidius gifuensis]
MEKMKEQGWYLTEQGFDLISDSGAITDVQKLIKRALDMDLREIGSGQGDINKGNLVLQIQKLRNVAAPKNNQESKSTPRMLKYYLTDGKNNYQAIELEHISLININTLPGTKILLKFTNILQSHGIYLLKPSNILNILGGKVINLIEKWELNKKLAFHSRVRSAEEGGPPPWIPFGKKIIKITEQDKNFKSMNDKDIINKDNTEFEAQRQDAIAEAAKQGSKKIFGGGNKQLLDHSVQKIVDHGFNIDQAEYALKINRNNVDRALKLLQKNDNRVSGNNNTRESRETKEPRGKRFEKKNDDTKPSIGKVSLFDFLENKLPAQLEAMEMTSNTNYSSDNFGNSRLDNNNYHERQHEDRGFDNQQGKGRRGGNRGGRGAYQAPPRHSDDSKFSKPKTNNENFNGNQYGSTNTYQGKPPRFQRNPQQSHYQQEQSNRGGKLFQTNDRHNNDSSSGYTKNSSKNQYNDNNNRHQNQNESFDSFNKQNDFKNNSKSHNRSSFEVGPRTFNPSIEKNSKQPQTNKYQGNNDDNNLKSNNRSNFQVGPKTFNPASSSSSTDKNSKQIQTNKYQGNKDVNNASRVFTGPSQRNNHVEKNKIESNSAAASGGGGGDCNWSWKKGDKCMAKYWEDNRYYNAEVSAVSSKTCVVQFKEFGNYEEVLQIDCMPITEDFSHTFINENKRQEHRGGSGGGGSSGNNRAPRHEENYSGAGMEFRRSGGNIHKKKSQQRRAQAIYQPPAQRGHASNARENL